MSEAFEKVAAFTPQQLALLSFLGGGAGFTGYRLLSDINNEAQKSKEVSDNRIKLQLRNPYELPQVNPAELASMESTTPIIGDQMPTLNNKSAGIENYAAVGLGLPAGFLGAKAVYDHFQENEANKKIEEAKKQYGNQLALAERANGKIAEETPLVDSFCKAAADELEKSALNLNPLDWDPISALTKSTWQNPTSSAVTKNQVISALPNDPLSRATGQDAIRSNAFAGAKNMLGTVTGHTSDMAINAWKALAAAGTIGTLGWLLHQHAKKKAKE